jgi:hypothetical protein
MKEGSDAERIKQCVRAFAVLTLKVVNMLGNADAEVGIRENKKYKIIIINNNIK